MCSRSPTKTRFFVRVLLHIVWASAWAVGVAPGNGWWALRSSGCRCFRVEGQMCSRSPTKTRFFVRVLLHIVWVSAWPAGVAPGYGRRGLRWDAGGGWWVLRWDAGGGWWVLRWDAGGGWWVLRREMAGGWWESHRNVGGGLFEVPGASVFALRNKCAAEVRQKRAFL